MNDTTIDLNSLRAQKARLGHKIGHNGYQLLITLGCLATLIAIGLFIIGRSNDAFFALALALIGFLPAAWWRYDLNRLPAEGKSLNDRLSVEILARLRPGTTLNPQTVWQQLSDYWHATFISNHLLIPKELINSSLATDEASLTQALQMAVQLADQNNNAIIEPGFLIAGLLLVSPNVLQLLNHYSLQPNDVVSTANWLGRNLANAQRERQDFGGIARDWAFGFTPLLNRFGENISMAIVNHGAHFDWLTNSAGVRNIEAALNNHASAIALVGPEGVGKTTSIYALAQRLIEGGTSRTLAYHQIIGLNASTILSNAHGQGDLESIIMHLINEANHAGHVILFLDDAQLFFNEGPGSFNASQILLPIVRANAVQIILAMTPNDYQRLRAINTSLATLMTPVVLQELPEADTMRVLEDTALNLESRHHILIAYDALKEAYRLSGRYEQDEAYPGKAIKLLEQAVGHTQDNIMTVTSVQQAIEQTRGVKVGTAVAAEADTLLHLEDSIHERMINQTHAVQVVANALRRARAGVANPRRPIGSFLFLGPTGVGKTELAKAIAATYFGDEQRMIRLDMSEYQQPDDVQRLLSNGQNDTASLIMSVRQQPFSVVLLDEIEKSHPNVLNLLLQLLDEGQLTDASGRSVSFKDCIIIATSNAGANTIRERVAAGQSLESFSEQFTDELISSGQFKPELLNRFDEIVLFRPLNTSELAQVVQLMLGEINKTLANQNITVALTEAAVAKIVAEGNDPRLGARPMRRTLQRAVEDTIAQKILRGETRPGDQLTLDVQDLTFN